MTTYFQASEQTDKDLLPPAARTNQDLAKLAARVEKEVISQYTRRAPATAYTARAGTTLGGAAVLVNSAMSIYVYLRGYTVDASDPAVDAGLKDALKNEIADVIAWRIAQRDVNVMTTSESSSNDGSKSLRQDVGRLFPPGFGRWLKDYDLREPAWGV